MKIIKQTQTELQLTLRKGLVGVPSIIIGSFCFLVGVLIFMLFGKLSTLRCNRIEPKQGGCQLVRPEFFGTQKKTIPLNELHGAEVFRVMREAVHFAKTEVVPALSKFL